ncbi:unnamed protein product [Sphenostylis stenocarpa]|uniref:Uncharacterized protein n=1 Tax=Sphenostylis stenocarpa TaxID=92480 RepID=A0AA86SL41_9FABA|nr:unnamed protein product [Sphenostylis stenocarpa]
MRGTVTYEVISVREKLKTGQEDDIGIANLFVCDLFLLSAKRSFSLSVPSIVAITGTEGCCGTLRFILWRANVVA